MGKHTQAAMDAARQRHADYHLMRDTVIPTPKNLAECAEIIDRHFAALVEAARNYVGHPDSLNIGWRGFARRNDPKTFFACESCRCEFEDDKDAEHADDCSAMGLIKAIRAVKGD